MGFPDLPIGRQDGGRGRPPIHNTMLKVVYLAKDVFEKLKKIPSGKQSEFISNTIRPSLNQFDPNDASVYALTFKFLLDSGIDDAKKTGNYELMTALGHLANDMMPKLEPYLALSEYTTDGTTDQIFVTTLDHKEKITSKDIIGMLEDTKIERILKNVFDLVQILNIVLDAVPQKYHDHVYRKNLTQVKDYIESFKKLFGDYDLGSQVDSDDNLELITGVDLLSESRHLSEKLGSEKDFGKHVPVYETLKSCKEILGELDSLADMKMKKFLESLCKFADNSVRQAWASGINVKLSSYRYDLKENCFIINLINLGDFDITVTGIQCDENQCSIHIFPTNKKSIDVKPTDTVIVAFAPCSQVDDNTKHSIVVEISYIRFSFILLGTDRTFSIPCSAENKF